MRVHHPAIFAASIAVSVAAQAETSVATADAAVELGTITVTGEAPDRYRFRDDTIAPKLQYEAEYFERFEPLSVGDMLRQVPGVAFTSDIGEYDAPQLRGIGSEYTQVLINGQRVPGAGGDADDANRGIFVDRIPAELVERIEIIRSPQADLDSQGIGGTINIVLKTSGEFSGGQFRAGAFNAGDGTTRGSGYAGYAGQSGPWSYLGGVNVQGRYVPKDKKSRRLEVDGDTGELVLSSEALEDDVRDTVDIGLNAGSTYRFGSGASLGLRGFYLDTDRDEDQQERVFDDAGVLAETAVEAERIREKTLGLGSNLRVPAFGDGEWAVGLDYGTLNLDRDNRTEEVAIEDGERTLGTESIRTDDDEWRFSSHVLLPWATEHRLKLGVQLATKDRDSAQRVFEGEGLVGEPDPALEEDSSPDALYEISEQRYDLYAQNQWQATTDLTVDAGLRVETTELEQDGFDSDGAARSASSSETEFNPNAHLRYRLTRQDQIRASVARTVRRPNFNDLVPFLIEDDEEFFVGNPDLQPETAIGYDLGFEHRFARQQGIVGINLFFRDISDLVQDVQVDDTTSPDNVGDGKVWGVELDSSLPLAFAGLPGVNVYGNYTYLKSEVDDPSTGEARRFNRQPIYVYNLGFTHKIEAWRITWGASFQQQGKAREFAADETGLIEYDGNLEAFIEYRISPSLSVRLNGNNLIDASKDEVFKTFDDVRPVGVLEEVEYETERVGRITVLTLRGQF